MNRRIGMGSISIFNFFIRRLLRKEDGLAAADVILIIAAVSIPLIIVLVAFGNDIVDYLEKQVKYLS